ncbi:amidohydrolase family protein [Paroceanicella profunda]|uniref:amidohydrolase family protein n=1 Tax=Paroceanicella profunda TaxID=2579971 RepID=UPI00321194B4
MVFALAAKHGKPVDIHLHERDALGAFSMELILERTKALGMEGLVTVSHAFCLGMADRAAAAALTEALAEARVHIITTAPASTAVPAVKELAAAGVLTGAGSDGIRDTWGPYGNADMLERAMLIGLRNNLRRDDELALAFDICTRGGAAIMALPGYGLAPGDRADAVLLTGETLAEAIVTRAPRPLVVKGGRVVARDGAALRPAP